jgi:chromosome segregation ATPase
VHEQEVSELSRLQTIVGFDPTQFYRSELERAVRDIRGDFEQLNHEQKRELEEWYKIKTEEVEREVQKDRELQRLQNTGISVEEATNLRSTHSDSLRMMHDLQSRHSELLVRLRELEEEYEHQKAQNSVGLAEREREIQLLHEKISELMQTYDELMGRKTSLEFEINTYRRLLECEETRVQKESANGSSYRFESKSGVSSAYGSSGKPVEVVVQRSVRSNSAEKSPETIMKRMQVQRTSKGELNFVIYPWFMASCNITCLLIKGRLVSKKSARMANLCF